MDILTRSQWAALPAKSIRAVAPEDFDTIEFHHSGGKSSAGADEVARSIQTFHMKSKSYGGKGWQDIFYNWLIAKDGTIIEGRGWGTSPRNENYMVVCFIGNYDVEELSEAQKAAGVWLRNEFVRRSPQATNRAALWHNQRQNTICPGENVEDWVREMNQANWQVKPQVQAAHLANVSKSLVPVSDAEVGLRADQLAQEVFEIKHRLDYLVDEILPGLSAQVNETLTRARILKNKTER